MAELIEQPRVGGGLLGVCGLRSAFPPRYGDVGAPDNGRQLAERDPSAHAELLALSGERELPPGTKAGKKLLLASLLRNGSCYHDASVPRTVDPRMPRP